MLLKFLVLLEPIQMAVKRCAQIAPRVRCVHFVMAPAFVNASRGSIQLEKQSVVHLAPLVFHVQMSRAILRLHVNLGHFQLENKLAVQIARLARK